MVQEESNLLLCEISKNLEKMYDRHGLSAGQLCLREGRGTRPVGLRFWGCFSCCLGRFSGPRWGGGKDTGEPVKLSDLRRQGTSEVHKMNPGQERGSGVIQQKLCGIFHWLQTNVFMCARELSGPSTLPPSFPPCFSPSLPSSLWGLNSWPCTY